MKRHLLRGTRIARLSCLAFVLLGFSQMVKAQPIVINSNFSLAVFAKAPTVLTNPDSITTDAQGTIFVEYANVTQPDVSGVDITFVRLYSTVSIMYTYQF